VARPSPTMSDAFVKEPRVRVLVMMVF